VRRSAPDCANRTPVPAGFEHWELRLLADQLVEKGIVDCISYETVRQVLKKNEFKPWQKQMWCIPEASAEYVARMEDILDLYEQPHNSKRPLICYDEGLKQLIEETCLCLPIKPGDIECFDCEYQCNGVRNLNMFFEPLVAQRKVRLTERHTMQDFAHHMQGLVAKCHSEVEIIRVVLDNLDPHKPASLYETFPPEEAGRIFKKLEFHYTPKHGSWLNMAEIELSAYDRRLKEHIPDDPSLFVEVQAITSQRNPAQVTVDWQYRIPDARFKLKRLYPSISE
jgi:hypothetical protein